jgi:Tfp pilus assembly protein PilV
MPNKSKKYDNGISLIELVLFIVISGIVVLGLVGALVSLVREGTPSENIARANFLGQQKIEELTSNAFAAITTPDDVTVNNYGGFSGYTVRHIVAYIRNDLTDSPGGTPTNYKRITVEVTEPGGLTIAFAAIVSKRYYDAPQG